MGKNSKHKNSANGKGRKRQRAFRPEGHGESANKITKMCVIKTEPPDSESECFESVLSSDQTISNQLEEPITGHLDLNGLKNEIGLREQTPVTLEIKQEIMENDEKFQIKKVRKKTRRVKSRWSRGEATKKKKKGKSQPGISKSTKFDMMENQTEIPEMLTSKSTKLDEMENPTEFPEILTGTEEKAQSNKMYFKRADGRRISIVGRPLNFSATTELPENFSSDETENEIENFNKQLFNDEISNENFSTLPSPTNDNMGIENIKENETLPIAMKKCAVILQKLHQSEIEKWVSTSYQQSESSVIDGGSVAELPERLHMPDTIQEPNINVDYPSSSRWKKVLPPEEYIDFTLCIDSSSEDEDNIDPTYLPSRKKQPQGEDYYKKKRFKKLSVRKKKNKKQKLKKGNKKSVLKPKTSNEEQKPSILSALLKLPLLESDKDEIESPAPTTMKQKERPLLPKAFRITKPIFPKPLDFEAQVKASQQLNVCSTVLPSKDNEPLPSWKIVTPKKIKPPVPILPKNILTPQNLADGASDKDQVELPTTVMQKKRPLILKAFKITKPMNSNPNVSVSSQPDQISAVSQTNQSTNISKPTDVCQDIGNVTQNQDSSILSVLLKSSDLLKSQECNAEKPNLDNNKLKSRLIVGRKLDFGLNPTVGSTILGSGISTSTLDNQNELANTSTQSQMGTNLHSNIPTSVVSTKNLSAMVNVDGKILIIPLEALMGQQSKIPVSINPGSSTTISPPNVTVSSSKSQIVMTSSYSNTANMSLLPNSGGNISNPNTKLVSSIASDSSSLKPLASGVTTTCSGANQLFYSGGRITLGYNKPGKIPAGVVHAVNNTAGQKVNPKINTLTIKQQGPMLGNVPRFSLTGGYRTQPRILSKNVKSRFNTPSNSTILASTLKKPFILPNDCNMPVVPLVSKVVLSPPKNSTNPVQTVIKYPVAQSTTTTGGSLLVNLLQDHSRVINVTNSNMTLPVLQIPVSSSQVQTSTNEASILRTSGQNISNQDMTNSSKISPNDYLLKTSISSSNQPISGFTKTRVLDAVIPSSNTVPQSNSIVKKILESKTLDSQDQCGIKRTQARMKISKTNNNVTKYTLATVFPKDNGPPPIIDHQQKNILPPPYFCANQQITTPSIIGPKPVIKAHIGLQNSNNNQFKPRFPSNFVPNMTIGQINDLIGSPKLGPPISNATGIFPMNQIAVTNQQPSPPNSYFITTQPVVNQSLSQNQLANQNITGQSQIMFRTTPESGGPLLQQYLLTTNDPNRSVLMQQPYIMQGTNNMNQQMTAPFITQSFVSQNGQPVPVLLTNSANQPLQIFNHNIQTSGTGPFTLSQTSFTASPPTTTNANNLCTPVQTTNRANIKYTSRNPNLIKHSWHFNAPKQNESTIESSDLDETIKKLSMRGTQLFIASGDKTNPVRIKQEPL